MYFKVYFKKKQLWTLNGSLGWMGLSILLYFKPEGNDELLISKSYFNKSLIIYCFLNLNACRRKYTNSNFMKVICTIYNLMTNFYCNTNLAELIKMSI